MRRIAKKDRKMGHRTTRQLPNYSTHPTRVDSRVKRSPVQSDWMYLVLTMMLGFPKSRLTTLMVMMTKTCPGSYRKIEEKKDPWFPNQTPRRGKIRGPLVSCSPR